MTCNLLTNLAIKNERKEKKGAEQVYYRGATAPKNRMALNKENLVVDPSYSIIIEWFSMVD